MQTVTDSLDTKSCQLREQHKHDQVFSPSLPLWSKRQTSVCFTWSPSTLWSWVYLQKIIKPRKYLFKNIYALHITGTSLCVTTLWVWKVSPPSKLLVVHIASWNWLSRPLESAVQLEIQQTYQHKSDRKRRLRHVFFSNILLSTND